MDRAKIVKPKSYPLLFLSLVTILIASYILLTFPPSSSLHIFIFHISYILIFFILFFLFLYGLAAFFLRSAIQGILIASAVIAYFLFSLNNLTNPLFLILLIVLFGCLEVVFWKK